MNALFRAINFGASTSAVESKPPTNPPNEYTQEFYAAVGRVVVALANNPSVKKEQRPQPTMGTSKKPKHKSHRRWCRCMVNANERKAFNYSCFICNKSHPVKHCHKFWDASVERRQRRLSFLLNNLISMDLQDDDPNYSLNDERRSRSRSRTERTTSTESSSLVIKNCFVNFKRW